MLGAVLSCLLLPVSLLYIFYFGVCFGNIDSWMALYGMARRRRRRRRRRRESIGVGISKVGNVFYSVGALVALYFFLFHSMNWAVRLDFREFVSFFPLFPHI